MPRRMSAAGACLAATLLLAASGQAADAPAQRRPAVQPPTVDLRPIKHIVVIYLENHSFDNLFGDFPGANGRSRAGRHALQVDKDGKPYRQLPPVVEPGKPPKVDPRFPEYLPNAPFLIDRYVGMDAKFPSPVHAFYDQQEQIDGGKMDKFVAYTDVGGLVMGYEDGSRLELWKYAEEFTLADNFYHAAFGGSFLNHFWTICACTPRFENAPEALRAVVEPDGKLVKNGKVTPDGYAVNTLQSVFQPHDAKVKPENLLPPQTARTIGDELSAKNVSWAWYSGGWNDALAGTPTGDFQYHHQPFAYFARYGDGTEERKAHLKDETELIAAIDQGTLPSVVFWKPVGELNEHPGYADTLSGDRHMADVIEKIRHSPLWRGTVIIVTYDENGGLWDHVSPPRVDRWGPGARVPTVIISPFAKRHYIDHTFYDTTAILRLIEARFGLQPLGARDRIAAGLWHALDLH